MKIIIILSFVYYLIISVSFAQQCTNKTGNELEPLMTLAQNSLSSSCLLQKERYNCKELEAELEGNEKKKIIQCDAQSIEENQISHMSLADCVVAGVKISTQNLLDLPMLAGIINKAIVKSFHENQLCSASIDQKRELLTAYNLSVSDSRFKLSEQFLGKWLEDTSCAQIKQRLDDHYQMVQGIIARERNWDFVHGKKVVPFKGKNSQVGSDLIKLLEEAMAGAQIRYECYTPKIKAEIICAGVTSLIVDAAMGLGTKSAISKMRTIIKSSHELGAIKRTVASVKDSTLLLIADRKKAASLVLNKKLTEVQEKAIIDAHEIGLKEGRSYLDYTPDELHKKVKILKEAGFNAEERALLMRSGITGQFSIEEAKKVVVTAIEKEKKNEDPKKTREILEKLDQYLEGFNKATDPADKANYAKLLGEVAQTKDVKTAKVFYQMGLDKVKALADKDRDYFKRTKTLDNYLDLASKAGDQAAVEKAMGEYVKKQFAIDSKRLGWKNLEDAASEIFDRLEREAQHYKTPKYSLEFEATIRKQKALMILIKRTDKAFSKLQNLDADYSKYSKSE